MIYNICVMIYYKLHTYIYIYPIYMIIYICVCARALIFLKNRGTEWVQVIIGSLSGTGSDGDPIARP